IGRDARRRAVVVGVVLDVVPEGARREPEPPGWRREGLHRAPYQIAERIRIDLARLREANAVPDVPEASVDAKLPVRFDVEVRPAAELAVPVPGHDADVVVDVRRQVVARDVGATFQIGGVA